MNDKHRARPSRQRRVSGLWQRHEDRLVGTKEEQTS